MVDFYRIILQENRSELQRQTDENTRLRQTVELKKNEYLAMKQRQEEEKKRKREEELRQRREAEARRKKEEEERRQKEREMEGIIIFGRKQTISILLSLL